MNIPELNHEQYDKLIKEAGGHVVAGIAAAIDTYWLIGIKPDRIYEKDWEEPYNKGLRVQYLNVTQPHMYITRKGQRLLIFPAYDKITYKMIASVWPAEPEWLYVIKENLHDDLDDTEFFWQYGDESWDGQQKLPAFKLEEVSTH